MSRPGTSADYWKRLCGVEIGSTHEEEFTNFGGTLSTVDGVAYYYDQLHHFPVLYAVPESSVLSDGERVRATLGKPVVENVDPNSLEAVIRRDELAASRARSACAEEFAGFGTPASSEGLARLRAIADPRGDSASWHEHRLSAAKRVGFTAAAEGSYLSAWWAFVFLGALVPGTRVTWRWRISLAPLLLFAPFFLGYAPMSLTFGPGGGLIYPAYVSLGAFALFWMPCTALDRLVWQLLPRPLLQWSLLPGPPLAWSAMVCAGPVQSLLAGLALVAALSLLGLGARRVTARWRARSAAPR